ncbi:MAG: hypothetical protein RAK24_04790, partial [TACK group archaeon]|nr:hypothetical protein [TACK group archaeon]
LLWLAKGFETKGISPDYAQRQRVTWTGEKRRSMPSQRASIDTKAERFARRSLEVFEALFPREATQRLRIAAGLRVNAAELSLHSERGPATSFRNPASEIQAHAP